MTRNITLPIPDDWTATEAGIFEAAVNGLQEAIRMAKCFSYAGKVGVMASLDDTSTVRAAPIVVDLTRAHRPCPSLAPPVRLAR